MLPGGAPGNQSPKHRGSIAGLVGFQPPPNVMDPGKIRGKIRTGAKTASKEQEREFLDRLAQLAADLSPLIPEWDGPGPSPFHRLERRLTRIQRRKDSLRWLKWLSRGKKLHHAYAASLLVLHGGKIPSFASMKFQGRDAKYALRGKASAQKLLAIQNFGDPDLRLVGYTEFVQHKRLILVSTAVAFYAIPAGGHLRPGTLSGLLEPARVVLAHRDAGDACEHAEAQRLRLRYDLPDLSTRLDLCTDCVRRLGGTLSTHLERAILSPAGRLKIDRSVTGTPWRVHPETAAPEMEQLVTQASQAANKKAKDYEQVTDLDLATWTQEALQDALNERATGFILAGEDVWLGEFAQAAATFASDDVERRALQCAFTLNTPRLRVADPSVNKLLEPLWNPHGPDILRAAAQIEIDPALLKELAERRPTEAFVGLARLLKTEERFKAYPRFDDLAPLLRLAHDLFKAFRSGDSTLFNQRLNEGVQTPSTKPLTLALARAFRSATTIEWKYSPHEKDEALFFDPYAKALASATPETYEEVLGHLATALNLPIPRPSTPKP